MILIFNSLPPIMFHWVVAESSVNQSLSGLWLDIKPTMMIGPALDEWQPLLSQNDFACEWVDTGLCCKTLRAVNGARKSTIQMQSIYYITMAYYILFNRLLYFHMQST